MMLPRLRIENSRIRSIAFQMGKTKHWCYPCLVSRTTDARWGNRLHCTAENQLPPEHILSATPTQIFRFLWFMPSLDVRSPCGNSCNLEGWFWYINLRLTSELLLALFIATLFVLNLSIYCKSFVNGKLIVLKLLFKLEYQNTALTNKNSLQISCSFSIMALKYF